MNIRKKILVLASTFPRWDNDTTPPFVYELEKRLTDDYDITVLAPHHNGAKKYEEKDKLKIYRFQYFWPAKWQKLCYEGGIMPNIKNNKLLLIQAFTLVFFEFIAALKIIKKRKINLIHAHWIIPQGIVALLIKKIFKIPYIITVHGGDIYGLQANFMKLIKKKVFENANKITVVSTAIKKEILNKINQKLNIDVIPMGVDSELFNPDKYDETIKEKYDLKGLFLLFVGRLMEVKGVKYILQAIPIVIKKIPDVKLLIIGEGPLESELRNLTSDLTLDKNVIFLGPITNSELPRFYATADIFIGPSIQTDSGDTEGLGLTFVEAAFSGCIPIGTNVGGISDVIKNNETGILVKEKNSSDIGTSIIRLLNNYALMTKIKNNLRRVAVKKYDWAVITKKYTNIYL